MEHRKFLQRLDELVAELTHAQAWRHFETLTPTVEQLRVEHVRLLLVLITTPTDGR